jgi:NADPH:quinone reductase-like Zn-dependent oxidoreductase
VRAVVIENNRLLVEERPIPEPGDGQLLLRVEAAGLNGADLAQRAGNYPAPADAPPDIPGLECCGTVVAAGSGATRHQVGDRVMSITGGGAQAEYCLVYDATAIRVPDGFPGPEAGGFAEVFTTAHDALFTQCGLAAGERLLVTGAAGGVGVASVQLGHLRGAHVTASLHNPAFSSRVAGLGADAVITPEHERDGGPYDVVIELVGGGNLGLHLRALSTGGRIVVIGIGGTGPVAEVDLRYLMVRRAALRGSTLRARTVAEKAATAAALEHDTLGWLEDGSLRVPLEAVFALGDVEAAYERFEQGGKFGKIVLDCTG